MAVSFQRCYNFEDNFFYVKLNFTLKKMYFQKPGRSFSKIFGNPFTMHILFILLSRFQSIQKNYYKLQQTGDGIGRAEEGAREDERGGGEGSPDVGERGNHHRHVHLWQVQGKEVHLQSGRLFTF